MAKRFYDTWRGDKFGLDEDYDWLDESAYPLRLKEPKSHFPWKVVLGAAGGVAAAAIARKLLKRNVKSPDAPGGTASPARGGPLAPRGPVLPSAPSGGGNTYPTKGKLTVERPAVTPVLELKPGAKSSVIYLPAKASPNKPSTPPPTSKPPANRVRTPETPTDKLRSDIKAGSAKPKDIKATPKPKPKAGTYKPLTKEQREATTSYLTDKPPVKTEAAPKATPVAAKEPVVESAADKAMREEIARLKKENATLATKTVTPPAASVPKKTVAVPATPGAASKPSTLPTTILRRKKQTTAERVAAFSKDSKIPPKVVAEPTAATRTEGVIKAAKTVSETELVGTAGQMARNIGSGGNPFDSENVLTAAAREGNPTAQVLESRLRQAANALKSGAEREDLSRVRNIARSTAVSTYKTPAAAEIAKRRGAATAGEKNLTEVFHSEFEMAQKVRSKVLDNPERIAEFAEEAVGKVRAGLPASGAAGKVRKLLSIGLLAGAGASALTRLKKDTQQ